MSEFLFFTSFRVSNSQPCGTLAPHESKDCYKQNPKRQCIETVSLGGEEHEVALVWGPESHKRRDEGQDDSSSCFGEVQGWSRVLVAVTLS